MKQFTSGNLEILGSRLLFKSHVADVKWANRWLKPTGSSPCHISPFVCCLRLWNRREKEPGLSWTLFPAVWKRGNLILEVLMAAAQTKVSFQIWEPLCSDVGDQRLSNFKERAITTFPSVLVLLQGTDMDKIFFSSLCIFLNKIAWNTVIAIVFCWTARSCNSQRHSKENNSNNPY